jgi:methylase of polypeptide subunit release factors
VSVTLVNARNVADSSSVRDRVRINSSDAVARVREWLVESGYARSATQALTKGTAEDEVLASRASELPVVKLLLHSSPLELKDAKQLFDAEDLQIWIDAGLLAESKNKVVPLVRITAYRELFVVSDCDWTSDSSSNPDVVMGLTSSSICLADFTIRRDADVTLDLGTGTGVQAMLAAKHSRQVVATDVNPRALAFARFNAALNGIDNIEFVQGDMFEAVEGRTFDLILCNPPFTVSPATACLYRDNPMDGDEFVKQVIQAAPVYLNDGGYAQILCNWAQYADETWTIRLSGWLKPTGCNAWVVRGKSYDPAEYARLWLDGYDTANAEELFGDWMSYYESQGIASIDGGLITMQRAERKPNWLRIDAKLPRVFPDAGAHVARCFWLQDVLDRLPDYQLLDQVLYLSPSVNLVQTSRPSITGWKVFSCQLTMTRGIAYTVKLDPTLMRIVAACNGRQQLGRLFQTIAIANKEDLQIVVSRYLEAVRRLVALGYLWPARHGLDESSEPLNSETVQHLSEDGQNAAGTNTQGCDEEQALSA